MSTGWKRLLCGCDVKCQTCLHCTAREGEIVWFVIIYHNFTVLEHSQKRIDCAKHCFRSGVQSSWSSNVCCCLLSDKFLMEHVKWCVNEKPISFDLARLQMNRWPNSQRFSREVLQVIRWWSYLAFYSTGKILLAILAIVIVHSARRPHIFPVN